jgi:hypothetical protein
MPSNQQKVKDLKLARAVRKTSARTKSEKLLV